LAIDWQPFLLRADAPEEGSPLPDRVKVFLANKNNPLIERAKKLGLTLNFREHIPNTKRAHACTEYARSKNKLHAFHHEVLERYWAKGEDLHEWSMLRAAAETVGLNADEMQTEVSAGRWTAVVDSALAGAHEIGINAVPTCVVANKYMIQGAQEASAFRELFKEIESGA
jgi:predicted DsbA family dithiol-disulfide isomerase